MSPYADTTEWGSPPRQGSKSKMGKSKIQETKNLIQETAKGIPNLMMKGSSRMTDEWPINSEKQDQEKN